jgi:signal transduction histidine kinase
VLDELREIARGLHPAALAEGGLPPALKTLARRSAVPVRLEIDFDRRLPEPIELAAYYVVTEALTNAAKHSSATVVDVHVQDGGGVLHVRVQDDGRGGADLTRGTGLVGLTDRVEALGGRLALHSPPGAGTSMQMDLPLTAPAAPGSPAADTGRPECTDRHRAAEPEPSGPARGS